MGRFSTAWCVGVLLLGASTGVAESQSIFDRIKKAAEEAKKNGEQSQPPPAQPGQRRGAPPPAAPPSAVPPAVAGNLPRSSAKVEELVLVSSAGQQNLRFVISPKGGHAATVVLRGSRMVVMHDGVDGPRFDEIVGDTGGLNFSPDGTRLGYVGREGTSYVYVVDGKELLRIPAATHPHLKNASQVNDYPHFTANSRHVFFNMYTEPMPGTTNGFNQFVYDGVPGPQSYSEPTPAFDAGGDHHAYMVENLQKRGTYALVADGKLSVSGGGDPQWTADGLHLITRRLITGSNATEVLVDGKPVMRALQPVITTTPVGSGFVAMVSQGNPGSGIQFLTVGTQRVAGTDCPWTPGYSGVTFSADGKHWAAVCQASPTSRWVVVDGKKGQEYQTIAGLGFLPDGRLAYAGGVRGQLFMVVGDQEANGFTSLLGPEPDPALGRGDFFLGVVSSRPGVLTGAHVGYVGVANVGGVNSVVVDGKVTQRPGANNLGLSPDGSRYAFTFGQTASGRSLNIDGTDVPGASLDFQRAPLTGSLRGQFVFSPDSKHIAYFGRQANGAAGLFVDGKFLALAFNQPMNLTFTSDSRHVIWMDRPGGSAQVLYVDGRPAVQMVSSGLVSMAGTWEAGSDGTLLVIGQDGDSLKRYTITPAADTSVDTFGR